eukprot:m.773494 g.773494  ORF g.773494 m.773494 type:complete len:92 (-) comp23252_c1_seq2:561-836(-)
MMLLFSQSEDITLNLLAAHKHAEHDLDARIDSWERYRVSSREALRAKAQKCIGRRETYHLLYLLNHVHQLCSGRCFGGAMHNLCHSIPRQW